VIEEGSLSKVSVAEAQQIVEKSPAPAPGPNVESEGIKYCTNFAVLNVLILFKFNSG